jgi:hypothetical protein
MEDGGVEEKVFRTQEEIIYKFKKKVFALGESGEFSWEIKVKKFSLLKTAHS